MYKHDLPAVSGEDRSTYYHRGRIVAQARGGGVCRGVGEGAMCVKTFVKDTERLQGEEKKRKQKNSSQSPRLPALSDSFASL